MADRRRPRSEPAGDARYRRRPATEADLEFLWDLRVAAMKAYVSATWGWDETFQRRYFREHANPDRTQILLVQGEPAGALTVWEQDDALFLASIELLPEHQRRGLGTAIIENLCHEAAERGLPVALQVLKVNPAFRLYERLGFRTVRETETHFQMRYGD